MANHFTSEVDRVSVAQTLRQSRSFLLVVASAWMPATIYLDVDCEDDMQAILSTLALGIEEAAVFERAILNMRSLKR